MADRFARGPSIEQKLRDRIEELEEELRQSREAMRSADRLPLEWGLEPAAQKLILSLYKAPNGYLSYDRLFHAIDTRSGQSSRMIICQHVFRARRRLSSLGIEIKCRFREGLELPPASRDIIKRAIL